jgi:hypothetical protein
VSLLSFFQWCSTWAPIVSIRDSKYGMPAVQSVHLLGLTIFLAAMVLLNLRLAGVGAKGLPVSSLGRQLSPWARGGVTLSILSGLLIFLSTPGKYLGSNPFRIKMAFLCLAILFHFGVLRRFVRSEPGERPRSLNVMVACLSLTLWFGVGWAGRAIAFVP